MKFFDLEMDGLAGSVVKGGGRGVRYETWFFCKHYVFTTGTTYYECRDNQYTDPGNLACAETHGVPRPNPHND